MTRTEMHAIVSRAKLEKLRREEAAAAARQRWTPEKVAAIFQDFYDLYGRLPQVGDFRRRYGLPAYRTVVNLFGSRRNALIAAGLLRDD